MKSSIAISRVFLAGMLAICHLTGTSSAHDRLTPAQLAELKNNGTHQERLDRIRRIAPHVASKGLVQTAIGKLKIEALKAAGFSDQQIGLQMLRPQFAFPYAAPPELKSTGKVKSVTILVDFKDYRAEKELPGMNAEAFRANIYGPGTQAAKEFFPYESVREYYARASEGKSDFDGDVLGWYHFPKDREKYYPTDSDAGGPIDNRAILAMAKEALASYDANHDFTQYDNDKDGDIDLVTILYAGPDTGWGSFWWAYRWQFFDEVKLDGKRLKQFVFQFVNKRGDRDFDPGVLIHEVGHAYGLPDYYDYNPEVGPTGGLGGLDMMDGNWGNQNAFSRWLLDWIKPEVVGQGAPEEKQLAASGAKSALPKAIAVFPNLQDTNAPSQEMFIVENRFRVGNDSKAAETPNDGLLVWHVVAKPNAGSNGFQFDNSFTDRKLIRLVRADAQSDETDFGNNERATADVYFLPPKALTPTSVPSTKSYNGNATGVTITDISEPGEVMKLKVGFVPVQNGGPILLAPPNMGGAALASAPPAGPAAAGDSVNLTELDALAKQWQEKDPDALAKDWASLRAEITAKKPTIQGRLKANTLVSIWAAKAGETALAEALTVSDQTLAAELITRGLDAWVAEDPKAATAWVLKPETKKSLVVKNAAISDRFTHSKFQWLAYVDQARAIEELNNLTPSQYKPAIDAIMSASSETGALRKRLDVKLQNLAPKVNEVDALLHLRAFEAKLREASPEARRGLINAAKALE